MSETIADKYAKKYRVYVKMQPCDDAPKWFPAPFTRLSGYFDNWFKALTAMHEYDKYSPFLVSLHEELIPPYVENYQI